MLIETILASSDAIDGAEAREQFRTRDTGTETARGLQVPPALSRNAGLVAYPAELARPVAREYSRGSQDSVSVKGRPPAGSRPT